MEEEVEDNIIRPVHTLLLSYGQTVNGKTFPMTLEATFEVERLTDSDFGEYMELRVKELTGTNTSGRVFNMMSLIEAEDEITESLMTCILYNEEVWDEEYLWWCDSKEV